MSSITGRAVGKGFACLVVTCQNGRIILETAVGRKKDVYDIGVHGEIQKVVVTSVVMRLFLFCQVRQELARTFVIQLRFLG